MLRLLHLQQASKKILDKKKIDDSQKKSGSYR